MKFTYYELVEALKKIVVISLLIGGLLAFGYFRLMAPADPLEVQSYINEIKAKKDKLAIAELEDFLKAYPAPTIGVMDGIKKNVQEHINKRSILGGDNTR